MTNRVTQAQQDAMIEIYASLHEAITKAQKAGLVALEQELYVTARGIYADVQYAQRANLWPAA